MFGTQMGTPALLSAEVTLAMAMLFMVLVMDPVCCHRCRWKDPLTQQLLVPAVGRSYSYQRLAFTPLHAPLSSCLATSMQPLKPETPKELVSVLQAQPKAISWRPPPGSPSLTLCSETQLLHKSPQKRYWENKQLLIHKKGFLYWTSDSIQEVAHFLKFPLLARSMSHSKSIVLSTLLPGLKPFHSSPSASRINHQVFKLALKFGKNLQSCLLLTLRFSQNKSITTPKLHPEVS